MCITDGYYQKYSHNIRPNVLDIDNLSDPIKFKKPGGYSKEITNQHWKQVLVRFPTRKSSLSSDLTVLTCPSFGARTMAS